MNNYEKLVSEWLMVFTVVGVLEGLKQYLRKVLL